MNCYWRECVEGALDEAGIAATEEQIGIIVEAVAAASSVYGESTGSHVAQLNLNAARDAEVIRLKEELARERARQTLN
jgi:hypothetical protein